jgi:hypothetical protein
MVFPAHVAVLKMKAPAKTAIPSANSIKIVAQAISAGAGTLQGFAQNC